MYRIFDRRGNKGRIKYSEVKDFIETVCGWKLNAESYTNETEPLSVTCPFGHNTKIKFVNFRTRQECPICEMASLTANTLINLQKEVKPKQEKIRRVIGIDNATHISGYSIFDNNVLIDFGTIEAPNSRNEIERMISMRNWLINVVEQWDPDMVFLEDTQLQADPMIFKTLSKNLGILEMVLVELNVPYEVVSNKTWKAHSNIKGSTRIEQKSNARKTVRDLYQQVCTEDEADAILLGKYGVTRCAAKFNKENKEDVIFGF